jgi:hypothetical protein
MFTRKDHPKMGEIESFLSKNKGCAERRKAPGVKGTESLTCAREGIRTPNLLIRSQMLYPLSYARLFICEVQ